MNGRFPAGAFVTWKSDNGAHERNEGRVLRDDGRRVTVLSHNALPLGLVLSKRECPVHLCKWRDRVKVGDVVEVSVLDQEWHPSIVRAVQRPGEKAVLVVEPAFLGYTISVPLWSLKVRSPQIEHCELQSLLDMGLAFDDFNSHATNHPEYHPYGNLDSPGAVPPEQILLARDTSTTCWVVQAPCTLPDRVQMVRTSNGSLEFCLNEETLPAPHANLSCEKVQRRKIGTVRLPTWDKNNRGYAGTLANILHEHLEHGDDNMAARMLHSHQDTLLSACAFDEKKEELAVALCTAAHKAHGVHVVSRDVWQHGYGGKDYFFCEDLKTLHLSLQRIVSSHCVHDLNVQELMQLDMRLNMWQMYKSLWGRANDLRLALESVQPVEVRLAQNVSSESSDIAFDVYVNYNNETLYRNTGSTSRLIEVDSVVLQHFSQPVAQDERQQDDFDPVGYFDTCATDEHKFLHKLSTQCVTKPNLSDIVLSKESQPSTTLEHCLARKIIAEDGTPVFWNLCEGVVQKLVVNFDEDDEPEPLFIMQQPPAVQRQGGVLIHDNTLDKMHCVADILKTERLRQDGPVDRGSTLLLTTPTLMYEWQRFLKKEANIDSHIYHGVGRRGPAAIEAMNRGDVVVASWSVIQSRDDCFFFGNADTPLWRIFVDEFDTTHASFVSQLLRLQSRSLWLLSHDIDKNLLALALPTLGVRPFSRRSGWAQSVLCHYSKRRHIMSLLHNVQNKRVRRALHVLYRQVFLVQTPSEPCPLLLTRQQHTCLSSYDKPHADVLKLFGSKLKTKSGHPIEYACPSLLQNLYKKLMLLCWGVMPPLSYVAHRLGFGRYNVDSVKHLKRMVEVASKKGTLHQNSYAEAVNFVQDLSANTPVNGRCPVCLEDFCEKQDESGALHLQSMVVVGTCGHAVCGECADNIQRVAMENRERHANDYGSEVPVNRASCPICRHSWVGEEALPLIKSAPVGAKLHAGQGGVVYSTDCSTDIASLTRKNPLFQTLRHVLEKLQAKTSSAVLVCRSHELADHLHQHLCAPNVKTMKITRFNTPKSRGNVMKIYSDVSSRSKGELALLIVTASLVKGMIFPRTRHYVVPEELKVLEAASLKRCMRSSLMTVPVTERHLPVQIICIAPPLMPLGSNADFTRVAPTTMIQSALQAGCVPMKPSKWIQDEEYIARLKTFFGQPYQRGERARKGLATVHPSITPLPHEQALLRDSFLSDHVVLPGDRLSRADTEELQRGTPLRVVVDNQTHSVVFSDIVDFLDLTEAVTSSAIVRV